MKKWTTVMIGLLLAAGAMAQQDVVVNIGITIPGEHVAEMADVINNLPDRIYTNALVVTTNAIPEYEYSGGTNQVIIGTNWTYQVVTNTVIKEIPETPRDRFRRVSAHRVLRYWRAKVRQYRAAQQSDEDLVETD